MVLRTVLLISDDPDDHTEFSEALYEVSGDTVLVSVTDLQKAISLLMSEKCIPDYIVLSLSVSGFAALFPVLQTPALNEVRVVAYGEAEQFAELAAHRIVAFIDHAVSYSELKRALGEVITGT